MQRAGCSMQQAELRGQRSDIGGQRFQVRVKPISDLRLLTSVVEEFYAFYDFYELTNQLILYPV